MNERNYNNQSMIDYLLGDLTDAELERFDELSFTDESFSDAVKAVENDLIDAYLRGELSATTLKKFKTHYLASPRRREKVEFAQSLQSYAEQKSVQVSLKSDKFAEKSKILSVFSSFNVFAHPALRLASVALIVLLFAVAGFWFFRKTSDQTELAEKKQTPTVSPSELPQIDSATNTNEAANNKNNSAPQPEKETPPKTPIPAPTPKSKEPVVQSPVVAAFVLQPPLRGASNLPNISFSKKTTAIKITLILEANDYKKYRVALVDESNRNLRQSGNLKPVNKTVTVDFPANALKSGVYSLILAGVGTDESEIISTYSFRSVLK